MKIKLNALLFIAVIILLFSCEKQRRSEPAENRIASSNYKTDLKSNANGSYLAANSAGNGSANEKQLAPPNPADNYFISSSAAVETDKDSTHRFVRTADMRFRVKNVYTSSMSIEDITKHFGGFVTATNISSDKDNTTVTPISSDSSLESIYYTVTNTVILRVPNIKLDSTLRAIAANIDYLDYRKITAEDVAPQLLADRMKQIRLNRHNNRLSNDIDKGSHKLNESTDAEQSLLDKDEEADNTKLNALSLVDRIKFSTVNLDIYQRPAIKRQIIANDKNIRAYEPPLGSQIADAFKTGWKGLCEFLLMFIFIWPIVVIAVAAFMAYRKWWRK